MPKEKNFFDDLIYTLSLSNPWQKRTTLHKLYTVTVATIVLGLLPMPYEFYTVLRCVVFIAIGLFCIEAYKTRDKHLLWVFFSIMFLVIYNPFTPIHLGEKPLWMIINAATLYMLYKMRMLMEEKNPDEVDDL